MSTLTAMISDDSYPLDYYWARRIRGTLVDAWRIARDQSLTGYDSLRAECLGEAIELLPGVALEIYLALHAGDAVRRLWAGRAYAGQPARTQRLVLRLLRQPRVNEHCEHAWRGALAVELSR